MIVAHSLTRIIIMNNARNQQPKHSDSHKQLSISFEKQCSIMASCWTERGQKHSAYDKPINRICHSPINIKHSFPIFDQMELHAMSGMRIKGFSACAGQEEHSTERNRSPDACSNCYQQYNSSESSHSCSHAISRVIMRLQQDILIILTMGRISLYRTRYKIESMKYNKLAPDI